MSSPAVVVREYRPEDEDACRALFEELVDVHRRLYPDAQIGAAFSAEGRLLVAEHDGEVVAFCYGGPSRTVSLPGHPGEIYAIYALPEHQGHGHGAALIREAAKQCLERGWRGATVWVLRENAPARRFYERMGARYLEGRDETRELDGVPIIESGYAWDDVSVLARGA